MEFGGAWTQRKLEALGKYLRAYTTIFKRNPRARYFTTSYVDAFAGTGSLSVPEVEPLFEYFQDLAEGVEEYRKGSARRALEVDPPFDRYVFIEKDAGKCKELRALADEFPDKKVKIVNADSNGALLKWCKELDIERERAVVFLDPFGASVEWPTISALGQTRAVDLWVLFPFFAVNRMLVRDRKPPKAWASRLTKLFGSADWEKEFYSRTEYENLLDPTKTIEQIYKTADHSKVSEFFIKRLQKEFRAVGEPLALHNSKGALLFLLYFAAGNERSAKTGLKIANDIVGK